VLDRVGLRSFRSRAALGHNGYQRVTLAEDASGGAPLLTAGYAVPTTDEELPLPPRWGAVQRFIDLTGGAWVRDPEELRQKPSWLTRLPVPPAVLILAAAVSLLLAEVLIRTLWEE